MTSSSTDAPVVVLGPASGPVAEASALSDAWAPHGRSVLRPDLTPGPGTVVLEDPGLRVLAAVSAAGAERAVLYGSGYGAMVALHLGAHYPARVAALVLTTRHRLADRTRRGLGEAVVGLLPVSRAQQLGTQPGRILAMLDEVRTVDYAGFVARVGVPALVLVGQRDPANLPASRRLAALLPHAELAVATGATSGWETREPGRLAELASEFLARLD